MAAPLFEAYWSEGQWYLKDVVDNLLRTLDVDRPVELEAPEAVEMFLTEKAGHLVVHLVNYRLHNETNQVEEAVPVHDVVLRVGRDRLDPEGIEVVGADPRFEVETAGDHNLIRLERVDVYTQVILDLK